MKAIEKNRRTKKQLRAHIRYFMKTTSLYSATFHTPLGSMVAITNADSLYLLEFSHRPNLAQEIEQLKKNVNALIILDQTLSIMNALQNELNSYFAGTLKEFTIPFSLIGSPFQKRVWQELQQIPFGETRSYAQLAAAISNPKSFRAAAQANKRNQLAIIIPCHRIIYTNGNLGGYAGGVSCKQLLLEHEQRFS